MIITIDIITRSELEKWLGYDFYMEFNHFYFVMSAQNEMHEYGLKCATEWMTCKKAKKPLLKYERISIGSERLMRWANFNKVWISVGDFERDKQTPGKVNKSGG